MYYEYYIKRMVLNDARIAHYRQNRTRDALTKKIGPWDLC